MKSLRFPILVAVVFLLAPTLFAADFGVRAGRASDTRLTGNKEEFVGAEVLFDLGAVNINPNVEYWLTDDITAGSANFDVTVDFGSSIKPYVGAGVGIFYIDDDFLGDDTELIGNLLGGVAFNFDFLKPYAQVKYSKSLEDENGGGGNDDEISFAIGLRF